MTDAKMAWIDLETTGLYADSDVPLELGLALTDEWGALIADFKTIIWEDTDQYKNAWADMPPFVKDMHQKNGLAKDLDVFTPVTRKQAEKKAIDWFQEYGVQTFTLPMAGSSIGSLDRPFCQKHMPNLNAFFHYRNIDISTVRELCRLHNPVLLERIEESIKDQYLQNHRVLEDIQDSITLYRALYENFLILED